jgi:thioredoxin reductase (NADPH)
VLGAGDQAIEEGDYLTNFARKVHIVVIHKEGKLDANQVSAARAYANPKIDFIWNSTISRVYGDKVVEGITLKNVQTAEEKDVPADGVFFFVGMVPQSAIVADLVRKDKAGYILVDKDKQTSVSGLYAVGDVTDTYVRQIATAAGDGAIAAIAAERYLSEKRTIKQLLNPESGKVAFVFYSPYDSKALAMLPNAEKELIAEGYKVFRQDISRQKILYNELGLKSEFVIQKFFNGQKED